MFKTIVTLFRGAADNVEESFKDANAHQLLQQHMRDAGHEVNAARKAVAIAIAQNKQEQEQYQKLVERLDDIESRALDALEQGKTALASEAAQTIAYMEAERDTSQAAQAQFETEIARLKANVQVAESKFRELQRGQRLATATQKTQDLRSKTAGSAQSSLRDAEDTLNRLRRRQQEMDLTEQAIAELDATGNPEAMAKKMAEAGCGKPQTTSADDVLERLKTKASKRAKSKKSAA